MRKENNLLPIISIGPYLLALLEEVDSKEQERAQSYPQPPTATPMSSLRIRPLSIKLYFTDLMEILTLCMLIPILQLWLNTSVLSSTV